MPSRFPVDRSGARFCRQAAIWGGQSRDLPPVSQRLGEQSFLGDETFSRERLVEVAAYTSRDARRARMVSVRGDQDVQQKLLQLNTLIGRVAGFRKLKFWGIAGTGEISNSGFRWTRPKTLKPSRVTP